MKIETASNINSNVNQAVIIGPADQGSILPWRTGDFPDMMPYTSDPIEPYVSPIQVIPGRLDIFPLGPGLLPNVLPAWPAGVINLTSNSPWKLSVTIDGLCCRCDVPGAKVEDINVNINNGNIVVSYKRFDDGTMCYPPSQLLGSDYDASTAEATLECGVLTVNVKRFPPKGGIKVTVTGK